MSLKTILKLKDEKLNYIIEENNKVYVFRLYQISKFVFSFVADQ